MISKKTKTNRVVNLFLCRYKTAKPSQNALIKESEEKCAKLRENFEESETARRRVEESAQELEMQLSQNKELLQQSDVR